MTSGEGPGDNHQEEERTIDEVQGGMLRTQELVVEDERILRFG